MESLNGKIDSDPGAPGFLPASEWNQAATEVENVILDAGIALSSGDLTQLSKAVASYSSGGFAYTDSGAANAYVLTPIGSKKSPPTYINGMTAEFTTANPNTGASTVNVSGLGVKDIRLPGGAAVAADQVSGRVKLIFDLANDWFELQESNKGIDTSSPGYVFLKFSNTINFLVQWGTVSLAQNASTTVTFPQAFPVGCVGLLCTPIVAAGTGNGQAASGLILSTTQANIINTASAAVSFSIQWVAIGF